MTNSTNQITVSNSGRGRKTGAKTVAVRRAVIRTIKDVKEPMTTNDIAKKIKKSKHSVVMALRWLEQKGYVQKVGQKKVKEGRGRPSAVWAVIEDYVEIDKAEQARVQEYRQFIRKVAVMTFEERKAMVEMMVKSLAELQTEDEVEELESKYKNAQGFTKANAKRGVEDAAKESFGIKEVNYWLKGNRIFKYRKQLGMA